MDILIEVTRLEPPTGRVRVDSRDVAFRSWLELLQVLAEVLPPPAQAPREA